ncbi:diaminopimelate epimerase [Polyangium sp. y55x31]|uniref:diaminopimelate epimerase n=1 Tax=Polyangium sp. y55x31 TaxID=3042688 RepID=UPI0024831DCF|nr:diaminopimelate epimerase [Polyangium sp. y55x31]MDI1480560.1 diaminopimelate epimerase [Polyangium sp. y55x31]
MSGTLAFEKWEGLGNDFVVIEASSEDAITPEQARALCDRHRGIGGDGVLLVIGGATPRMVVLNADGSRPEMCGNGLRCVAAFLADRTGAEGLSMVIATDAGDKPCAIERRSSGLYDVTVDMGHAKMGPRLDVEAEGRKHGFATVDVGNPHAITFEPYTEEEIDRVGPTVATAPAGGINVEFCRMLGEGAQTRIGVTVWERGVGRTLACGTGACAVAAAACEEGRARRGAPIEVFLPGGPLEITVDEARALRMKGPARRVFRGTWETSLGLGPGRAAPPSWGAISS